MATSNAFRIFLSALSFGSALSASVPRPFHLEPRYPTDGCNALQQQFPSKVFFPNSTVYTEENAEFWSETVIKSPWCIFTPECAEDVAGAIKIVVLTQTKFAVRGGGHMPIPGAASTSDGVLFAMDRLNSLELANGNDVAKLGAGLRWETIYGWLEAKGLTVIGGRYAPVGIGGYMIGGGISYYISEFGWAVDHVANYEVVTADGNIVNANAESNPDLFWSLKGGSTNFAVVTRYDLKTYPLPSVYAGFIITGADVLDQFVQATADYITGPTGGNFDKKAAANPTLEFTTDTRVLSGVNNVFYNGSADGGSKAFENFTKIATSAQSTVSERSLTDFLNETVPTGDRHSNKQFGATALKNTADSVKLMAKVFQDLIAKVKTTAQPGFVSITFQGIAESGIQAAADAGGEAIDLDPADGGVMTVLFTTQFEDAADIDYFKQWVNDGITTLDQQAKDAALYYPFIYLNDAAEGQQPLHLYGKGKSIERLRRTAAQYDPDQVFQKLAAGAFKLTQDTGAGVGGG